MRVHNPQKSYACRHATSDARTAARDAARKLEHGRDDSTAQRSRRATTRTRNVVTTRALEQRSGARRADWLHFAGGSVSVAAVGAHASTRRTARSARPHHEKRSSHHVPQCTPASRPHSTPHDTSTFRAPDQRSPPPAGSRAADAMRHARAPCVAASRPLTAALRPHGTRRVPDGDQRPPPAAAAAAAAAIAAWSGSSRDSDFRRLR